MPVEPTQERVELPTPPVIRVGLSVHVRPLAGEIENARLTGRAKPLKECITMVEFPLVPALTPTDAGTAVRVKYGDPGGRAGVLTVKSSQLLGAPLLFESPL